MILNLYKLYKVNIIQKLCKSIDKYTEIKSILDINNKLSIIINEITKVYLNLHF